MKPFLHFSDLPQAFWLRLFDRIAESDGEATPRYARASRQAEYGVSRDDFANANEAAAVEDACDYFRRQTEEQRREWVARFAAEWRAEALTLNELALDLDRALSESEG